MSFPTRWIIGTYIPPRDREILFLTLEAVGVDIFIDTRNGISAHSFPYIGMDIPSKRVVSFRCHEIALDTFIDMQLLSYETVLAHYQQVVRSQTSKFRNMSKPTLFYHTPRTKEKGGEVRYTIAGRVTENRIELCAARCTEGDQFEKRKGRLIAEGRLNSTKKEVKEEWGAATEFNSDELPMSKAFLLAAKELAEAVEQRIQNKKQEMKKKK